MEMTTVSMTVPKEMTPFLNDKEEDFSFERNAMILYPFISKMVISHGRAAEILGVRKWDLIEYYNSVGLPYLRQSKEELISDLKTFEKVKRKNK